MSDDTPADADAGGRQLLRSGGIVAVGTLLSRITGLGRTVLFVAVLGQAGAANIYNLANTTPNLLYDLLLGGILTATLVPVLVSNRDAEDRSGTDAVITVATIGLVAMTIVGFVFAPLIIKLYALLSTVRGGVPPTGAEQDLATLLLLIFVPQILFYGLTTLGSSLLNTNRRFAAAAFAPVLNNIVMIGVLIAVWRMLPAAQTDQPAALTAEQLESYPALLWTLALGTTFGIAAMALSLWPAIRRAGIPLRWRPDWRNPSVRKVARLSGWTLGYVIANQIAFFILTGFLWGTGDAGVSAWGYAYILFQLPYGVFTVAVMTTFTPELAGLDDRGEQRLFNERFLQGLRLITVVILPMSLLFVVFARPLVAVLFEHGSKFTSEDAAITASAVGGLALGMIGFSVYLYVLRAFNARKDTKTPFLINLFENALTIVLALIFMQGGRGVQGLAWAWSAAYSVSAVVAFVVLHRRVGPFGLRLAVATTAPVARMVAAAVAMTVVLVVLVRLLPSAGLGAFASVLVGALVGGAVYFGLLLLLGVAEVREVPRLLTRR